MIWVRNFRFSDIEEIDKIFKGQDDFGIPGLNNLFTNVTVVRNDRVVGYGSINIFAECFMILDPRLRKREKAEAAGKVLETGILRARDAGLEVLYLISNTKDYTKVLRNKYGFKAVPGELLMLDLTEDQSGKQEREED